MTPASNLTCPLVELLAAVRTPPPAAPRPPAPPAHPHPDEQPRLLWTTTQAAARISVGKSVLYGLMRNDVLPSVLLGGKRLVAEVDLQEYVQRLRDAGSRWDDER